MELVKEKNVCAAAFIELSGFEKSADVGISFMYTKIYLN